jgi:drug/metabolite transporter (DMT)-like permease
MGKEKPARQLFVVIFAALAGLALALGIAGGAAGARWNDISTGVAWAFGAALAFTFVLYANAHALSGIDGRLRTFVMAAVTAVVTLAGGALANSLALPRDGEGWLGLALLTAFYGTAMCVFFVLLPRLRASTTVALNFEPIALLALGWLILGQAVTPVQVAGAFLTVGAIVWLGLARK